MATVLESTVVKITAVEVARRRVVALLCFVICLCLIVEASSLSMRDHRSSTLSQEREIDEALAIRPVPSAEQVLVAGNSLVFDGIDAKALQQAAGSSYVTHAAGIPGSTLSDWQYGLQSLFERGSRPDIVVFAISPLQMLRGSTATPVPVARLWSARQIWSYYKSEHIPLSEMADLVLEHYSVFFSMRDTFRIYIRKWIPGYARLANEWLTQPSSSGMKGIGNPDIDRLLRQRLSLMNKTCRSHGSRFVFLIVPTHEKEDSALEPYLISAAQELGVPLIVPAREGALPLSNYKPDGYHLTPKAASAFSSLVGAELRTNHERFTSGS